MQGKVPMNSYSNDKVQIADIKCEDMKEYVDTSLEDDEILREIIEEEKKKRAEFEKDRNVDLNKKKTKKKKKKSDL